MTTYKTILLCPLHLPHNNNNNQSQPNQQQQQKDLFHLVHLCTLNAHTPHNTHTHNTHTHHRYTEAGFQRSSCKTLHPAAALQIAMSHQIGHQEQRFQAQPFPAKSTSPPHKLLDKPHTSLTSRTPPLSPSSFTPESSGELTNNSNSNSSLGQPLGMTDSGLGKLALNQPQHQHHHHQKQDQGRSGPTSPTSPTRLLAQLQDQVNEQKLPAISRMALQHISHSLPSSNTSPIRFHHHSQEEPAVSRSAPQHRHETHSHRHAAPVHSTSARLASPAHGSNRTPHRRSANTPSSAARSAPRSAMSSATTNSITAPAPSGATRPRPSTSPRRTPSSTRPNSLHALRNSDPGAQQLRGAEAVPGFGGKFRPRGARPSVRLPTLPVEKLQRVASVSDDDTTHLQERFMERQQALHHTRQARESLTHATHRVPQRYMMVGQRASLANRVNMSEEELLSMQRLSIAPAPELYLGKGISGHVPQLRRRHLERAQFRGRIRQFAVACSIAFSLAVCLCCVVLCVSVLCCACLCVCLCVCVCVCVVLCVFVCLCVLCVFVLCVAENIVGEPEVAIAMQAQHTRCFAH